MRIIHRGWPRLIEGYISTIYLLGKGGLKSYAIGPAGIQFRQPLPFNGRGSCLKPAAPDDEWMDDPSRRASYPGWPGVRRLACGGPLSRHRMRRSNELADLAAAHTMALRGIRGTHGHEEMLGKLDLRSQVDIADATGEILMPATFVEAVEITRP